MQLELIYPKFPFWRAEVCRLALFIGDVPFSNSHPSWTEIREMKKSGYLPFGQVPVLVVDGTVIAQTGAIARFCGKLSGLYPTDDHLKAAKIDQILDAATDITMLIAPTMREKNPEKKLLMRQDLATTRIPKWLGYLERFRTEHQESQFFVGESLTIADIAIWRLIGWLSSGLLDGIPTTIISSFPLLQVHAQQIGSLPKIKQWMTEQYDS